MGNTLATYMETLKKTFLNEDIFISERGYDFSLKSRIRQAKYIKEVEWPCYRYQSMIINLDL